MRIAVLVSGNGTNLQALMDAQKDGQLSSGEIVLVLSDNKDAFALKRAERNGIRTVIKELSGEMTRKDLDDHILRELEGEKIELVVLAGYMRILGPELVKKYRGRILNIHPALLPAFKGVHGIRDAYECGVKITGVTVHFVDEGLDSGPIILQEPVRIGSGDTLDALEKKIHEVEHRLYPEAVRLFVSGKLKMDGRKVIIQ
ncbi:MAG: phosphoribosylglycinamide formyltransferase [Candidatus Omnitrophica bacterium]|nr:phosphoribosylglycinamide formyltransferase [Candidatus Omnitrophota bacterium]MDD5488169.1 phosphoribosylglycinamide formyltransferase [Candidatus Omnitrophota bacterium]